MENLGGEYRVRKMAGPEQLCRKCIKSTRQLRSNACDTRNYHHCNQCRNETVFDSSCAGFIGEEFPQNIHSVLFLRTAEIGGITDLVCPISKRP